LFNLRKNKNCVHIMILLLLIFLIFLHSFIGFEDVFKMERIIQLSEDVVVGSISDLVVRGDGKFIISDPMSNAVFVFGRDGKFLSKIGSVGSGPGEFISPNKIALDEKGNLYVEDRGNRRINVYDSEGRFKFSFKLEKGPLFSLKVNSGRIYAYCSAGIGKDERIIYIYDDRGRLINKFGLLPKFMWDFPFVISGGGMVIDSSGLIYQVHPVEYVVNKYSPDGKLLACFEMKSSLYKAPNKPDIETIQIEYQKWLNSWTPVSGLYIIDNKFLIILVSLGKEGKQKRFAMDIIDLNGQVFKSDILFTLSENATIIGSYGDSFYIAEQPPPDNKGNLPNFRIIEYKIKLGSKR